MKKMSLIATALLTSGLMLGTTAVAIADETPAPTTTPVTTPAPTKTPSPAQAAYKAALAQYKIDVTNYRVALVNNDIAYRAAMQKYWSDWSATNKAYWAVWQTTIGTYRTAEAAYDAQLAPLQAAHKSANDAADAAFLSATAGTPTTDQLNAALKAFHTATSAADSTYKAAVAALGPEPVRPVQPPLPVKPAAPVKPADPAKPVPPVKPGK